MKTLQRIPWAFVNAVGIAKFHQLFGWIESLALCLAGTGCVQPTTSAHVASSSRGMVVSVCDEASRVGANVLRMGGNAVDASVAVAFALAVTYPPAGNIGGGGFMLVYPNGGRKPICIDYRECAPASATPEMLADVRDGTDARMAGVPGTVRGLALAHEKYGKLNWSKLIGPAIELAEGGFPVNAELARSLNGIRQRYLAMAGLQMAYAPPAGTAQWSVGDRLVQRDLARTLQLIAESGADAFYNGRIADQIVAELQARGGVISQANLTSYHARLREPAHGTYRGFDIYAAPPPSSGGIVLVEMLNMLEPFELRHEGRWSTRTLHVLIECVRRAHRDRAEYLGDPEFVEIPACLTAKSYARELAASIEPAHATPSKSLAGPISISPEGSSTTHFSVIDKDGMAVANTYTLEDNYGSKNVVDGVGFLLNNEMGDFNSRPGVTDRRGHIGTPPNLIAPGKRMLSSQTPTIVARDGRVVLVTGSPGGRTITNTVLCVVLNILEFGMDGRAAVEAPRLHHQWLPDEVKLEASSAPISAATLEQLRAMGHVIRQTSSDGSPFVQRLADRHASIPTSLGTVVYAGHILAPNVDPPSRKVDVHWCKVQQLAPSQASINQRGCHGLHLWMACQNVELSMNIVDGPQESNRRVLTAHALDRRDRVRSRLARESHALVINGPAEESKEYFPVFVDRLGIESPCIANGHQEIAHHGGGHFLDEINLHCEEKHLLLGILRSASMVCRVERITC